MTISIVYLLPKVHPIPSKDRGVMNIFLPIQLTSTTVKMWIGLLAETPETRSSLGCGTWPQLLCCALVSVRVPEVRTGRVGASEQRDSSDGDQDSGQ